MSRSVFFGLICLLVVAACTMRPDGAFTIKGTINGLEGEEIYLTYPISMNPYIAVTDTSVVKNGFFSFEGELNGPFAAVSMYSGDFTDYTNKNRTSFYIEPTDMMVKISDGVFSELLMEGCATQSESKRLEELIGDLNDRILDNYLESRSIKDEGEIERIERNSDSLKAVISTRTAEFIRNNPDSYISAIQLRHITQNTPLNELKELYRGLSDRVKSIDDADAALRQIRGLENSQPGAVVPEIERIDINGNKFALSSLRGKVVILDFWASWCVPCRASNPHLLKVFKKYHDKGLEVVCIADNDATEDDWRAAVEQDQMGEYHHILRGFKTIVDEHGYKKYDTTEDLDALFAVHSIPTKFLIDRDGKIICRIVSEGHLDAELDKLFK